jgi:hypothetical protein
MMIGRGVTVRLTTREGVNQSSTEFELSLVEFVELSGSNMVVPISGSLVVVLLPISGRLVVVLPISGSFIAAVRSASHR